VYVLALSTDDVDDQAEALSVALRSRVRDVQGWSLLESPQSFETLSLALKCPAKPDAGCLQRVADQIHADHFVWGRVAHKKGGAEVTADLHMWSRSKGDSEINMAFSDNLKDAGDPSLRKVAARAFGKLVGSDATGTLVVHAGTGAGSVLVDGSVVGALQGGVGRFDVSEGAHKVAVRVPGFEGQPLDTTVAAGSDEELSFTLTPQTATASGEGVHEHEHEHEHEQHEHAEIADDTPHPSAARKVLAYSSLILGGGLLVGAGVGTVLWIKDYNKSSDDRQHVPASDTNVCGATTGSWATYAQDACSASKDATTVSTAAWIMGAGGAALGITGLILLVTDHSSSETTTHGASSRPSLDVVPSVGTRGASVQLKLSF
jgi:hypothetical protein